MSGATTSDQVGNGKDTTSVPDSETAAQGAQEIADSFLKCKGWTTNIIPLKGDKTNHVTFYHNLFLLKRERDRLDEMKHHPTIKTSQLHEIYNSTIDVLDGETTSKEELDELSSIWKRGYYPQMQDDLESLKRRANLKLSRAGKVRSKSREILSKLKCKRGGDRGSHAGH